MRDNTTKEKLKVIAGAVTALVIVGRLVVFALALMAAPRPPTKAAFSSAVQPGPPV